MTAEPLLRLGDHVTTVGWSCDGELVAAASLAGDTVVGTADGEVVAKLPEHPLGVLAAVWSPDGQRLAVGGQDGTVALWARATGDVSRVLGGRWVSALAWQPTGTMLAAAVGRDVIVLDHDAGDVARYPGLPSTVTSLAWSPDGTRLGAGCYGGVRWFEPPAGPDPVLAFDWKGSVLALALSPDGRWLASGNQDDSVHLWRLWSGEDLQMSGYPAKIEHLAWERRSRFLAVGSIGDVTVWDVSGKGPAGRSPIVLGGHARRVTAVSYQHDGELLAAASADAVLQIWDFRRSRKRPARTVALGSEPTCLAWRPATAELALGTTDGTVLHVPAG